ANVYSSDATAASVLTGLYTRLSIQNIEGFDGTGSLANIYTASGLSSDELKLFDQNFTNNNLNLFYENALTGIDAPRFWNNIYSDIFIANSAIEGISSTSFLKKSIKDRLLGEAKFMRAFYYFYLVNFYGDIPLVLTTDYKLNSLMSRTPVTAIYDQIVIDLKDAKSLLSDEYVDGNIVNSVEDRVRPNK